MDAVFAVLGLAACGGLLWVASRIEPHWCSKDGRRFSCRVQRLGQHDQPEGRWVEMRAGIVDRTLVLRPRGVLHRVSGGDHRVVAKSPDPPKRRAYYVVDGTNRLLLRVPSSSRAVASLDDIGPH